MNIFLALKLSFVAVGIGVVLTFYYQYQSMRIELNQTKQELQVSEQNNLMLEGSIKSQQATIELQLEEAKLINKANLELRETQQDLRKEYKELDRKFTEKANGEARSVANLALKKSSLIERVINKATANAMRCNEIAMGSPLTEDELNATKKSQINGECPSIANPNYIRY
jgi:predicted nuclease with TOPRIM domain